MTNPDPTASESSSDFGPWRTLDGRRRGVDSTTGPLERLHIHVARIRDTAAEAVANSSGTLSSSARRLSEEARSSASRLSEEARRGATAALTSAEGGIGELARRARRLSGGSEPWQPGFEVTRRSPAAAPPPSLERADTVTAEARYSSLGSPTSPLRVVNGPSGSSSSVETVGAAAKTYAPEGGPASTSSDHRGGDPMLPAERDFRRSGARRTPR